MGESRCPTLHSDPTATATATHTAMAPPIPLPTAPPTAEDTGTAMATPAHTLPPPTAEDTAMATVAAMAMATLIRHCLPELSQAASCEQSFGLHSSKLRVKFCRLLGGTALHDTQYFLFSKYHSK